MKRKLTALVLGTSIALSSTVGIFANNEITVKLDDYELLPTVIVEKGRTLVPFREILELMGATVDWNSDNRTITCTRGKKIVTLTIGASEMDINGVKTALDVPAKIVNGITFVPLRAISENFDADVNWIANTKTVEIKTIDTIKHYEAKDDDGTLLLEIGIYVDKKVNNLSDSAKEIVYKYANNLSIEEYVGSVDELVKSAKYAKTELSKSPYSPFDEFTNYFCKLTIDATENDKFVSIKGFDLTYCEGYRPRTTLGTKTFSKETGEEVTLLDVAKSISNTDGKEMEEILITNAIMRFKEKIGADPSSFFENAKENLSKLSKEDFYVTEKGIVFFFNFWVISPYGTIPEVEVPVLYNK